MHEAVVPCLKKFKDFSNVLAAKKVAKIFWRGSMLK